MCVQNFDDSRGPAIRITYRISLRSSSLWEPRHPLLKVVYIHIVRRKWTNIHPKGQVINTPHLLDSGYILLCCIGVRKTIPWHKLIRFDKVNLGLGLLCKISRRHPNQASHNGLTQSKDVLLVHGRGDLRSVW